jgi:hypothetical protein
VGTGFPKRSCSNKKIERDDDSKKSRSALEKRPQRGVRAEAVIHRTHWGLASGRTSTSCGGGNGSTPVTQLTSIDLGGHDDGTSSHSRQQLAAHGMIANKASKAA